MNTNEIIALLAIIAIGILYYFKSQQVKNLRKTLEKTKLEFDSIQATIMNNSNDYLEILEEREDLKSDLDNLQIHIVTLETDNQRLQSQLDQAQEQVRENSLDFTIINPVSQDDFPYIFQAYIDWGTINLSIKDLIGDDKLLEVFNSLVKSNLLPESIKESIDYEPKEQICYIFTNTHDEEGDTVSSLSWKGITNQILTKKQIVTDYLRGVIQDSDRAMVVHMALTNKPKKEVVNG